MYVRIHIYIYISPFLYIIYRYPSIQQRQTDQYISVSIDIDRYISKWLYKYIEPFGLWHLSHGKCFQQDFPND